MNEHHEEGKEKFEAGREVLNCEIEELFGELVVFVRDDFMKEVIMDVAFVVKSEESVCWKEKLKDLDEPIWKQEGRFDGFEFNFLKLNVLFL